MSDKLVMEFLKAQKHLVKPDSSKNVTKAAACVIRPEHPEKVDEEGFEYICAKKPPKKKVEKYLQRLIDEIMEAQDA